MAYQWLYPSAVVFLTFSVMTWTTNSNASLVTKSEFILGISADKEMELLIERGDLLHPEGASAYDFYKAYLENHPADHSMHRKLKRALFAALADKSDQALTEYFREGGEFIKKYLSVSNSSDGLKKVSINEYYRVAALLIGEDHLMYPEIQSKAYFTEALRLRYIENSHLQLVKESLEKSIALDPYASFCYNELGHIYHEETDFEQACANYRKALKLNPSWDLPRLNLKIAEEALTETGKY